MPAKKSAKPAAEQVRAYMAALPPDTRRVLAAIRDAIRAAAPGAVEHFSYGIPGFRFQDRPLVWYGAFKNHTSLFPITGAIQRAHAAAIEGYETAKGTIRFPLDEKPPITLIKRLVKARVTEVRVELKARSSR
jgi:uncharacterized protein YdhG (YjbR/CyaY superfamily)